MTKEEKDIIYKDACCRLPYHPYVAYTLDDGTTVQAQLTGADEADEVAEYYGYISDTWGHIPSLDIKPYLRPLSSMTEEEKEVYTCLSIAHTAGDVMIPSQLAQHWLLYHHFDINNLIEKELALIATEGMYEH